MMRRSRWIAAGVGALVLAFLQPGAGTGAATERSPHVLSPTGTLTASVVSHGVRMSLTVPRRSYPRDALVQFTVTLRNVGRADRFIQGRQPFWGGTYSPHLLTRSPSGKLFYEEDLSAFLAATPGNPGGDFVVRPGRTLVWHVRSVLRGPEVQAVTKIGDGYTAFSTGPGTPPPAPSQLAHALWRITTPFIRLRLTEEPAPAVTLIRRGRYLDVSVRPRTRVSGPLLYGDSARCWTGKDTMWTNRDEPWLAAPHDRFAAQLYPYHCPSAEPWRAIVGWPNHRVAFVAVPDVRRLRGRT